MSWLRIDDGFAEHNKVMDLSDRAFRLHVTGLCYCARNLTDGVLVMRAVKAVSAITFSTRRHITELCRVELWLPLEDGYQIKDFLDYNPDAASAKAVKAARSEAGKRGAKTRWGDSNGHNNGDGKSHSTPHMPPAQAPSPTPVKTYRPVGDEIEGEVHTLDSLRAASRLFDAIPESGRDAGTQTVVLGYARELEPKAFDAIRVGLERKLSEDGLFKNAGAYVNGALQKAARNAA